MGLGEIAGATFYSDSTMNLQVNSCLAMYPSPHMGFSMALWGLPPMFVIARVELSHSKNRETSLHAGF